MKYKTLFRLLLKAIGVWLFVDGAAALLQHAGGLVFSLGQGIAFGSWWYLVAIMIALLAKAVAGLYLFFAGEWVVNKAIPGNRPYCHECGYDLTAAVENCCPECGTPFRPEDVQPAGSRNMASDDVR